MVGMFYDSHIEIRRIMEDRIERSTQNINITYFLQNVAYIIINTLDVDAKSVLIVINEKWTFCIEKQLHKHMCITYMDYFTPQL